MASNSDQERTEQATPKRRRDARKKGQVARSRELPSVVILLGGLGVFFFAGSWMAGTMVEMMRAIFENSGNLAVSESSAPLLGGEIIKHVLLVLLPLLLAVLTCGLGSNILQIGPLLTAEPLKPKFSKLNPIEGLKRLFSLRSLVELAKSVTKLSIIGGVAYLVVKGEMESLPGLVGTGVGTIFAFIGSSALKVTFFTCLALALIALLDYAYQVWQHEKDLKMSKHEVKEELKQREGDPTVKGRIRQAQIEMAQRRMMEAVPEADVVVTNPTHLAIALKYDGREMAAPQVIAKGADYIAQRIKKIAVEADVPVVENKPLAQTLYKAVEIGDFVPASLYKAVAEVLAYVYRLKGKQPGS